MTQKSLSSMTEESSTLNNPSYQSFGKKDINKPFVTIQINEENYKRYQGHVLLNFKNKTTQQQKETANQLYNMNNFRLSVKNRKTQTYKEAEIAK